MEETFKEARGKRGELFTVIIAYRDKRPDKVYRIGLTADQVQKKIIDKMTLEEKKGCTVIGFSNFRTADKGNPEGFRTFHSYNEIEKR